MPEKKTHREVKEPRVSARHLAEFMEASERARRTIITSCKFRPIARLPQHDEAKMVAGKFIRDGRRDVNMLLDGSGSYRDKGFRTIVMTSDARSAVLSTIRSPFFMPSAYVRRTIFERLGPS